MPTIVMQEVVWYTGARASVVDADAPAVIEQTLDDLESGSFDPPREDTSADKGAFRWTRLRRNDEAERCDEEIEESE